ncbi:MAG: hypothetical protein V7K14_12645 [Nostoc sp.]|uniref:hypothetical protein n=1 Tax=Nostoc sp. TaxID=1180 RepID=UPI002FF6A098
MRVFRYLHAILLEINQGEGNLLQEDSYDWGFQGQPKGNPAEYIPGVGLTVVGGKNTHP